MHAVAVPIVLFVALFTFLTISAICVLIGNIYRTKAKLKFMQGLIERGYSALEIERILNAAKIPLGNAPKEDGSEEEYEGLNPRMTRPVAPVKQAVNS